MAGRGRDGWEGRGGWEGRVAGPPAVRARQVSPVSLIRSVRTVVCTVLPIVLSVTVATIVE